MNMTYFRMVALMMAVSAASVMIASVIVGGCSLVQRTAGDETVTLEQVRAESESIMFIILALWDDDEPRAVRAIRDGKVIAHIRTAQSAIVHDPDAPDGLRNFMVSLVDDDRAALVEATWLIVDSMIRSNFEVHLDPVFVATWSAAFDGMVAGAERHLALMENDG